METQTLECGAVWGGTRTLDMNVCSDGLTASVYSKSHDGHSGGDVYYFSVCSAGLLTRIALGDVQGHGKAVSHLSNWLYDALLRQMNSLEGQKVLGDLNPRVHAMGFKAITTMVVAGYYSKTATLYFAYAGHPPMLVWRKSDPIWRPLEMESTDEISDLPLGVFPAMAYQQGSAPLAPGDRVVLCTDGVLECESAAGEELGVSGLAALLNENPQENLAALKANLLQKLAERTNHAPFGDDVTFMFVEMSGRAEPKGRLTSRMMLPVAGQKDDRRAT